MDCFLFIRTSALPSAGSDFIRSPALLTVGNDSICSGRSFY